MLYLRRNPWGDKTMDKMTEEFEKQMIVLGFGEYQNDFEIDDETGTYKNQDLNAMKVGFTIGWQASRASIIIELPLKSTFDDEESDGYNEAIDDCKKAIRSAGIEVK